ncbi:MAG: Na+/H+ antiporter subunit E [Spirochaetaceae bacterium]|nr:Na+/H+ antiporter subunit E [Spirochaetaceae bacterium]
MPIIFFAFWIILNGRITGEVIFTGILTAVIISLLFYCFIGLSPVTEKKILRKIFSVLSYVFSLLIEMIKANIVMIKIVLSPVIKTKPQIKYFKSPVRSDIAKVALATSINLTPGTILVELKDDQFAIHSIDAAMLVGIENSWILVQKLKKIEGGHDVV